MQNKKFKYDPLQSMFYDMLKAFGAGIIERIVKQIESEKNNHDCQDITYSNNWLAEYAKELSDRINSVIDEIRSPLNFKGLLVKFKLQVGITETELLNIANESRKHSDADFIIANIFDNILGSIMHICDRNGFLKSVNRTELPKTIVELLENSYDLSSRTR